MVSVSVLVSTSSPFDRWSDGCLINTLRPGQNGRRCADDILKCTFLNENIWISVKISLKVVPKVRYIYIYIYRERERLMNLPFGECHRTSLMDSQHWISWWRRQATSHYLSQHWPISFSPLASLCHELRRNYGSIRNYATICRVSLVSQMGVCYDVMMTSSNGNIFRVTGHLCGEFTGPRTKASDAEVWCFLWSAPE